MSASISNQISLSIASAQSRVSSLLSPSGIIGNAVSDILTVASDIASIENTANAALSSFISPTSDPIQSSFSRGQPYSGTFITSPTVNLIPISLIDQALSSSTIGVALLSAVQIAALVARTGIDIVNDVDLANAMASIFTEFSNNRQLAFSVDLTNTQGFDTYNYTTPVDNSYYIPLLTESPNTEDLIYFITSIAGMFSNTPGIEGVVASVWVDGLGISVTSNGTSAVDVPQNINNGLYTDITGSATGLIPTSTPIALVDYSYQQNLLNTTLALAIDNGLVSTVNDIMTSPLVTPVSYQIIKNRLQSVVLRGDTSMTIALINQLGPTNVPDPKQLISTLMQYLFPNDVLNSKSSTTVFYANNTKITTNVSSKSLAELIADITSILTTLGITIEQVFSQNTCNSIFCSQSLLNVPMMKSANQQVIEALFTKSTVQMANMFH